MPNQLPNHLDSTDPSSFGAFLQKPQQSWISIVLVTALSVYVLQKLLVYVDAPFDTIFEKAWNSLVYLMPNRLAFALSSNDPPGARVARDGGGGAGVHAAKSAILRQVFGLDKTRDASEQEVVSGVPAGLGNWDNSCYQNSVLQSLAALESLQTFFNHLNESACPASSCDTTLSALQTLVRDLNDTSKPTRHLWTPPKLKSMSSWQQQDAQEYFSKIVDQLEKDIKVELCKAESQYQGLELEETPAKRSEATSTRKGASNPLEGLLAQRVGCTRCGYTEGLSLIPFNCITLPLGQERIYEIRDCLDSFTDLEFIEGVECAKCTLLKTRTQLEQLLHGQTSRNSEPSGGVNGKNEFHAALEERLHVVKTALDDEDFSDKSLSEKCKIPSSSRVQATKSRQAVVARTPPCLVLHVNRSLFDEMTGAQLKNHASVQFPLDFDLGGWCIGNQQEGQADNDFENQKWEMRPSQSMIKPTEPDKETAQCSYRLKAAITHYGRHENGHYICYRKVPGKFPGVGGEPPCSNFEREGHEQWWCLSDETVTRVTEDDILAQGGVFMLFYERVASDSLPEQKHEPSAPVADLMLADSQPLQSTQEAVPAAEAVAASEANDADDAAIDRIDVASISSSEAGSDVPPEPAASISPPFVEISETPSPKDRSEPSNLETEDKSVLDEITLADTPPQQPCKPPQKLPSPITMRTARFGPGASDERLVQLFGPQMVATS